MELSAMSFPDPKEEYYTLTSDDIISINEMMHVTYAVDIKINTERNMKVKQIFIFAPGRDRTWYTGQGNTVCEAVDHWFQKTLLKRWDISARRIDKDAKYLAE
jgi:sugar (pentulose or hexulose) kinase